MWRDQIWKLAFVKSVILQKDFEHSEFLFYPRILIFTFGISKIMKNEDCKRACRSTFLNFCDHESGKKLAFSQSFQFYSILNYHKTKTRTNFKNPNCKSLDRHLIMRFIIKKLLPSQTDFTVAIFKIPQKSKHFFRCVTSGIFSLFLYMLKAVTTKYAKPLKNSS